MPNDRRQQYARRKVESLIFIRPSKASLPPPPLRARASDVLRPGPLPWVRGLFTLWPVLVVLGVPPLSRELFYPGGGGGGRASQARRLVRPVLFWSDRCRRCSGVSREGLVMRGEGWLHLHLPYSVYSYIRSCEPWCGSRGRHTSLI